MSQLFTWGGQSTGVSALASFLPKNNQGWSPSEWTGWISLQSKGLGKSLLQHHSLKASILRRSAFFTVQLSHPYMTRGKTIALTRRNRMSYFYFNWLGILRWHSVKESVCHFRRLKRCRFDPWIGKIPWSRKWQPIPLFLPGKFHGQRSLAGQNPRGPKESDMT